MDADNPLYYALLAVTGFSCIVLVVIVIDIVRTIWKGKK